MTEPTDTNPNECLDCIDGLTPTTSPLIGHSFRLCPTCRPICPCCNGHGRWPAWTTDLIAFLAVYNDAGFMPILCHACCGLIALTPINQETP
jgi:hypothetical protein